MYVCLVFNESNQIWGMSLLLYIQDMLITKYYPQLGFKEVSLKDYTTIVRTNWQTMEIFRFWHLELSSNLNRCLQIGFRFEGNECNEPAIVCHEKLSNKSRTHIKELKYSFNWKIFSNSENYFDFYLYICSKNLKYGTKEFE